MHTNVHCSTVYNSKDLEPSQMPMDDRLDRENVAHLHHGILCSHQKRWVHVLCRDMDEPGNHHSQQTDTGTENQAPHVLTHMWVLNNENTWTRWGSITHWDPCVGTRGGTVGGRELGRNDMGRNARYRWVKGRKEAKHTATCVPMQLSCMFCTCTPKPKMQ